MPVGKKRESPAVLSLKVESKLSDPVLREVALSAVRNIVQAARCD